MTEHFPPTVEMDKRPNKFFNPLAERMESAIGEATSVMGAVITEMVRRSLRGGVLHLGEELQGYVAEQVDATLADRAPALEQAAADVADRVADKAARVAATEVAHEEIREKARELGARIEEVQLDARATTRAAAQELTGRIQEAEKRVVEATQAEVTQQVQDLLQRSRKGVQVIRSRLRSIEGDLTQLGQSVHDEKAQRESLRQDLVREMAQGQEQLRQEIARLLEENKALATRLAELEKPGWFRRFFVK